VQSLVRVIGTLKKGLPSEFEESPMLSGFLNEGMTYALFKKQSAQRACLLKWENRMGKLSFSIKSYTNRMGNPEKGPINDDSIHQH
jgi:hypothetical protein